MQHQRLLTLLMISIEEVMKNKMYLREMYGDQSIKLTLRLLRKCLDKKNGAFHLDKRYLNDQSFKFKYTQRTCFLNTA